MTEQDLQIEYKKEHGEYPPNDDAYIKWLEEKFIGCINNQDNVTKIRQDELRRRYTNRRNRS